MTTPLRQRTLEELVLSEDLSRTVAYVRPGSLPCGSDLRNAQICQLRLLSGCYLSQLEKLWNPLSVFQS